MILIVAAIFIAIAVAFIFCRADANVLDLSNRINCSQFLELKKSFPNQDKNLFKSLQSGVEGIVNENPPEASVFCFFSTDESLIENVMREVIRVTKQCINQSQDPLKLTKDQLNSQLVEGYKDELINRNIMVVSNVDQAEPTAVSALHSFCDTENPLVSKSIIFFTIKVPQSPVGKPVEYITKYLEDCWKNLADNIRDPLITRMLDQTFFLKP